jgi:hypothetical protein
MPYPPQRNVSRYFKKSLKVFRLSNQAGKQKQRKGVEQVADKLDGLKDFIRKEIREAVKGGTGNNSESSFQKGIFKKNLPAVVKNNDKAVVVQAQELSRMLTHESLFSENSIRQITAKGTLKVRAELSILNWAEYAIVRVVETDEIKTADICGHAAFKLMPGNYTVQVVSNDRQSFGMAAGTVYPGRTEKITVVLH